MPDVASSPEIRCRDRAETAAFARDLAERFGPGDVLLLTGPMAAGKTTFVAMLCEALDCAQPASSPTYTISNTYACGRFDVIHVDAWRLSGAEEFHLLGLEEFMDDALTLVEWGERVAEAFPDAWRLEISAGPGAEGRVFRLTPP